MLSYSKGCVRRYGLEFVNYVLRRLWFQRCTDAWLRRQNVTAVFEAHYNDLQKTTVAWVCLLDWPQGLCNT